MFLKTFNINDNASFKAKKLIYQNSINVPKIFTSKQENSPPLTYRLLDISSKNTDDYQSLLNFFDQMIIQDKIGMYDLFRTYQKNPHNIIEAFKEYKLSGVFYENKLVSLTYGKIPTDNTAMELAYYVCPDARKLGIITQQVNLFIYEILQDIKISKFHFSVDASNSASQKLLTKISKPNWTIKNLGYNDGEIDYYLTVSEKPSNITETMQSIINQLATVIEGRKPNLAETLNKSQQMFESKKQEKLITDISTMQNILQNKFQKAFEKISEITAKNQEQSSQLIEIITFFKTTSNLIETKIQNTSSILQLEITLNKLKKTQRNADKYSVSLNNIIQKQQELSIQNAKKNHWQNLLNTSENLLNTMKSWVKPNTLQPAFAFTSDDV